MFKCSQHSNADPPSLFAKGSWPSPTMISAISGFRILAHAVVEAICDPTWLMGHLLRQIRFRGSIGQRHLFYLSFCPFNNGTDATFIPH